MTERRVAITGLGVTSPYGDGGVDSFFDHLCRGQSAIGMREWHHSARPMVLPFVSCESFSADASLGRPLASMMDRHCQLGAAAAFAAWDHAGLPRKLADDGERDRWGVSWGSALGGIMQYDRYYEQAFLEGKDRLSPLSVIMGMNNATSAQLSVQLGLGGMSTTHAVACASSSVAIGEAFLRIRSGAADVMLAGGSDTPQALAVMRAWDSMRVLAQISDTEPVSEACRPFAADRRGLVLGEGGAALVLEDWEHAERRGATILAELAGYGLSSDHSHMVRPDPKGQERALAEALKMADLSLADVGYVNAHGTATTEGDVVEIRALSSVFGAEAGRLPVSSTKSMHGHLLGAAGAVEALVAIMAMREQRLPPTAGLTGRVDPACKGVDLVTECRTVDPFEATVSSSFAFGGCNAVLAFRRADR